MTQQVRRVKPMHFGGVALVEQHVSTHSTRFTRLDQHDELYWLDKQLSMLCNLYEVMIFKLFTNLMEYAFI